MAEQAILDQLKTLTGLGATLVAPNAGRVYPLTLPQGVKYPAATYQRITTTRYSALSEDANVVEATIQVDVYADRDSGYSNFDTTADAVRGALQRHRDISAGATPKVQGIFIDAERDEYEEDTKLYRRSFDVRVWYEGS